MAETPIDGARRGALELARECEGEHPADAKLASEALFERLKADPDLYAQIAEPFVRAECWNLIGAIRRKDRRAVWNAPNYEKGLSEAPQNVQHLSNANRTLMDGFALPDGTRLGDATREKLVEAATFYSKQALDMRNKGRFLAMLASKLRGTKRVRDVLVEADLISMRDRATNKDLAA